MSFVIKYNHHVHEIQNKNKQTKNTDTFPYNDWKNLYRHKQCVIYHTNNIDLDEYTICMLPWYNSMYMEFTYADRNMTVTLRYTLYDENNTIMISECTCSYTSFTNSMYGLSTLHGSLNLLTHLLQFDFGFDGVYSIFKPFFGSTCTYIHNMYCSDYVHVDDPNIFKDSIRNMIDTIGYDTLEIRTVGVFNIELEERAALVIQSAYKGWKARMMYRYNPHTPLGRYLALKLYQETCLEMQHI